MKRCVFRVKMLHFILKHASVQNTIKLAKKTFEEYWRSLRLTRSPNYFHSWKCINFSNWKDSCSEWKCSTSFLKHARVQKHPVSEVNTFMYRCTCRSVWATDFFADFWFQWKRMFHELICICISVSCSPQRARDAKKPIQNCTAQKIAGARESGSRECTKRTERRPGAGTKSIATPPSIPISE